MFCNICEIWHSANCNQAPCHGSESGCKPNRCKDCDRDLKRWLRIKKWENKFKDRFDWDRHRFLKFGTVGIPGEKKFLITDFDDSMKSYRDDLTTKFKKLRQTEVWKNHVDGGMWFFEITSETIPQNFRLQERSSSSLNPIVLPDLEMKINPHLHIVFFGPKKIPYDALQEACSDSGLGKFHFSSPKDKAGNSVIPGISNALDYLFSYLKKENQIEGRNRNTFGVMHK